MLRFTLSILLIFGLLQLNYSQNKIQQINLSHGSDYTPYEGLDITGWPIQTWLRGNKIYDQNEFIVNKNLGKYISRDFCML